MEWAPHVGSILELSSGLRSSRQPVSYQVLARKWRPQTFDAVVGQDAITRTLRNALASGRIAHAYLFAGPRGIGKTTTARLLARALLCTARTGPEPCGKCAVCVEGLAGTLVDVIEIDGASNRGIEEIRTLREKVKHPPARGRFKVYIIDEVHQLTEAAFNALLKTLEEPPPHIVFVLATTDPRDIPPTVLSRVQRFDFRPIAPDALRDSLERILAAEQIPFDAGALPVIVRAAEGSLRDALSLLDTAIAYGNGKLEAETAAKLLGATAPVAVRTFVAAVIGHETGVALEAIDRAARDGEDLLAFARDVIELLRLTLVLKAAPNAKPAELTHSEGNELRKLGEAVSLDEILYALRALLEADALMRKRPTLGAVLMQVRPSGVSDRELTVVLAGNNFHREMLADAANKEVVTQAVRRWVVGAERFKVESGGETTGAVATHPAVQAAIAEFQGEVVAVRPRLPEGEGQ